MENPLIAKVILYIMLQGQLFGAAWVIERSIVIINFFAKEPIK